MDLVKQCLQEHETCTKLAPAFEKYPTGRVVVFVPEAVRRKEDINLIERDHPLLPIALDCIKDRDKERPSADNVCERLAILKRENRYMQSVQHDISPLHMRL